MKVINSSLLFRDQTISHFHYPGLEMWQEYTAIDKLFINNDCVCCNYNTICIDSVKNKQVCIRNSNIQCLKRIMILYPTLVDNVIELNITFNPKNVINLSLFHRLRKLRIKIEEGFIKISNFLDHNQHIEMLFIEKDTERRRRWRGNRSR